MLKAQTGAHEVITTIMLNYLAGSVLLYLLAKEAFQRPEQRQPALAAGRRLGDVPDALRRLHIGVLLAFLAALGVWWLLERSTLGFEMRAVGANPRRRRAPRA